MIYWIAGPELDAIIAEKVMGWKRVAPVCWRVYDRSAGPDPLEFTSCPRYSSDIGTAWQTVEKLIELNWQPTLAIRQFESEPRDRFIFHGCRLDNRVDGQQHIVGFCGRAETAPLAICLGALDAMGKYAGPQAGLVIPEVLSIKGPHGG